jgi:6-phosphogluconolactonase
MRGEGRSTKGEVAMTMQTMSDTGAVFVQTNEPTNRVLAFRRDADGSLGEPIAYETGGAGSNAAHLPSQGSVILSKDRRFLLVTNAGSGDVSAFRVSGSNLERIGTVSTGDEPRSIAEHGGMVYVLHTAKPSITALRLSDEGLVPVAGGETALMASDGDPAQVGITPDGQTLVVTERGADAIVSYPIRPDGSLGDPMAVASSGPTPYGFAFASDGTLVVTEAFRAEKGAAAASSYKLADGAPSPVTRSLGNGMSEICWAVITPDDRFAFTTNFADSTVSRFAIGADGGIVLDDAAAGGVEARRPGLRDEDLTDDGRFLYAVDADNGAVAGWSVSADGELSPAATSAGLPATIAGLAAR